MGKMSVTDLITLAPYLQIKAVKLLALNLQTTNTHGHSLNNIIPSFIKYIFSWAKRHAEPNTCSRQVTSTVSAYFLRSLNRTDSVVTSNSSASDGLVLLPGDLKHCNHFVKKYIVVMLLCFMLNNLSQHIPLQCYIWRI